MKIVFDNIIFNLQKIGGISIYWSEILKRLIKEPVTCLIVERPNDNIVRLQMPLDEMLIHSTRFSPIFIERFINPSLDHIKDRFIFHSSYNRTTSNPRALKVITVHDFVHEKYYSGIRKLIHSYQKRKAILAADAIIVISESTRKDLMFYFPGIDPNKVKMIYNGVSDDFYPLKACHDKFSGADRPYLLFIGSREMYKNFNFTIELISHLPSYVLQIIGSALTAKELNLLNSLIPGRWKHSSYVSNSELNEIYNKAFALVYPSAYEGFGIPLVEAMKAGCPFIALNNSSIPEVAGKAGVLLDFLEIESAKEAVQRIASNREEIIEKGYKQVKKFSWDKCFQETYLLYKELYK